MFKKSKINLSVIAFLSAIPLTMAIQMVDTPLNWCFMVLCIYSCIDCDLKSGIKRAIIVGATTAIINFFWIISGTKEFTGSGILLGVLITAVFCIIFALYAVFVAFMYVTFRWNIKSSNAWWITSFLAGSLFVILDFGMGYFAKGFSTCMHLNYIPFTFNLDAIQPAAYLGPLIITFVVIMVNFQVAYLLYYKKWKLLLVPVSIVLMYLGIGHLLLNHYKEDLASQTNKLKPIKVAILEENLLPIYTWDSANGNRLASEMFNMNSQALKTGAKMFVWSETAIPWNYTPNDDFIQAIDSITSPDSVIHLFGMNTDYQGRTFYNSIYGIAPGPRILGRYDKRQALNLVEKPFMGVLLPFLTSSGFRVKEGTSDAPIKTPLGNAGILLCNESSISGPAAASVKAGAQFLVNPGNDGWFSSTYIPRQHFYHARLRAVENRKDIVVNNNNGYYGAINSAGEILLKEKNSDPNIGVVTIQPNNIQTDFERNNAYFVIFCFIVSVIILILNYRNLKMS